MTQQAPDVASLGDDYQLRVFTEGGDCGMVLLHRGQEVRRFKLRTASEQDLNDPQALDEDVKEVMRKLVKERESHAAMLERAATMKAALERELSRAHDAGAAATLAEYRDQ